MKPADFRDSTESVGSSATNGTHPSKKRNPPKRSTVAGKPAAASGPAPLAQPIPCVNPVAVDVPKWPLQSAAWLEPDVPPSPPAWSGLAVERHHRIPVPDFLPFDTAPLNRMDGPKTSQPAVAAAGPILPHSDLAPLGWDPRAVGRKERG